MDVGRSRESFCATMIARQRTAPAIVCSRISAAPSVRRPNLMSANWSASALKSIFHATKAINAADTAPFTANVNACRRRGGARLHNVSSVIAIASIEGRCLEHSAKEESFARHHCVELFAHSSDTNLTSAATEHENVLR